MKFLLSAAVLALTAQAKGKDGKCRILSCKGGGVHGSWEVGVLSALVDEMPEEVAYDYVAGVSVGSMLASLLATFEPGDEKEAVKVMTDFVLGFKVSENFNLRSPFFIKLFTENSMMTIEPMKKTLKKIFSDKPILRKLSIISVDIITGQIICFDETMPLEDRISAILSSSAIPFAFPPVTLDNLNLVDGSVFSAVSLGDPIERCREEGTKDEDIIIDVILCYEDIASKTIDDW